MKERSYFKFTFPSRIRFFTKTSKSRLLRPISCHSRGATAPPNVLSADTLSKNRALAAQKFTRRLEISTSTAQNSARRVQNREKPSGFSRYAEPQLNFVKQNSARRAQNREKPSGFSRYAEPQLNFVKQNSARRAQNREKPT
ncbi:MAG: hypothetical protein IJZ92_00215 [Bacteroidaceae bacterium]|nr:hypothetical protein [Bacteroidaceae bacterium]